MCGEDFLFVEWSCWPSSNVDIILGSFTRLIESMLSDESDGTLI